MEQSQIINATDNRDDTPVDNIHSTGYDQSTNSTVSDQVQAEMLKQLKELKSELNNMKKDNK